VAPDRLWPRCALILVSLYGRMSDYQIGTMAPDRGKTGEMSGENPGGPLLFPFVEAGPLLFPFVYVSWSAPPPSLGVTGDLDKEERRVGGRGNDLGAELRDAAAGSTSDHVRRFFLPAFPLMSSARPKSRGS
jgi:hypothetical protein